MTYGQTLIGMASDPDVQRIKTGLAAYIDQVHAKTTEKTCTPELRKLAEAIIQNLVVADSKADLFFSEINGHI